MSVRPELYQMEQAMAQRFPDLRPVQQRGCALWVVGTTPDTSACATAVLTALLLYGSWKTIRQRLHEWPYDGTKKAAPHRIQLDVTTCRAPLLRWILALWQGTALALALDATLDRDRSAALVVSVLYRVSALPVAWSVLLANTAGAWMVPILPLLRQLSPTIPTTMTALVLADHGLLILICRCNPSAGLASVAAVQNSATVAPAGRDRTVNRQLVRPGQA